MEALSSPQLGALVTNHRTSWVRQVSIGSGTYYVKTYNYGSWRDRWRGIGRTTLFSASRVQRERQALEWLSDHGFGGPRVRAVLEQRWMGWLCRGVLVTEAWPGENVASLLPRLSQTDRATLGAELRCFVQLLHDAGFRDRNLDLRNILVRREPSAWCFAKIDSPRHRIPKDARPDDALARADWTRLAASLDELDRTL